MDSFVTKFYSFPPIEKKILKEFLLSDEVDKWIVSTVLIPVESGANYLALVATNNLSIFDKFEVDLSATEIDLPEYAKAAKTIGSKYEMFYPSADISSLF